MMSSNAGPIRNSVVVNAGLDRAFALFVDRFDAIKPREHNLLAVPIAETVFEPHVGGRIYDNGVDASRCEWARVLVTSRPRVWSSHGTSGRPGSWKPTPHGRVRSR